MYQQQVATGQVRTDSGEVNRKHRELPLLDRGPNRTGGKLTFYNPVKPNLTSQIQQRVMEDASDMLRFVFPEPTQLTASGQ
jgi:hypothetical protein